jgi:hypothetical protein
MSLEAAKERLSREYLGRAGIHGIGLSKRQNAIRVHLAPGGDPEREAALVEALKRDAAPYAVLVVTEDRATAYPPADSGTEE